MALIEKLNSGMRHRVSLQVGHSYANGNVIFQCFENIIDGEIMTAEGMNHSEHISSERTLFTFFFRNLSLKFF